MAVTILSQWVDVAQRIHLARTHLRDFKQALTVDPVAAPEYVTECARISSELRTVELEVQYLYETLLQAQAAFEYTGEWAVGSKET